MVTGYAKEVDPSGKEREVFGATGLDDSRQDIFKLKLGNDAGQTVAAEHLNVVPRRC